MGCARQCLHTSRTGRIDADSRHRSCQPEQDFQARDDGQHEQQRPHQRGADQSVIGMLHLSLHPEVMLAFFQGTQLNLFERFLTQALSGIDSTGITSGMQNVAYVVLLVGFLWQVYQSALHGGDVRGLGTGLIKYVVTAVVVMNYGSVFTTINQGFVNGGNWVGNASGGNVLQNWGTDLQAQFTQDGTQQLWGLITGSIAGLIDGLLIIVAYLLYPIVVVIFGFFYIFYGSVLYIFGPIVIALMPLG